MTQSEQMTRKWGAEPEGDPAPRVLHSTSSRFRAERRQKPGGMGFHCI